MEKLVDADGIHRRLGTHEWAKPIQFGEDGWLFRKKNGDGQAIVTASHAPDDEQLTGPQWFHASVSRTSGMPPYGDLVRLHKAVWPEGYAYQVFAPPAAHINIHPRALHLWGRADGGIVLPDFGMFGTI